MLTDTQADTIIAAQKEYSTRERAGTHLVRADDVELRKAWLKKRFASFEYQELMLEIHAYWLDLLEKSLARAESEPIAHQPPAWLRKAAMPNFETVAKPGTFSVQRFVPGQTFGAAIYILDYNRDSGLDVASTWDWMAEAEQARFFPLWGYMKRVAQNIQYTVDDMWTYKGSDDSLLGESYTGLIDWPTNWRDDIVGAQAASLLTKPQTQRVKAGQPVPEDGTWQAIDASNQRLQLRAGDVPPDLGSPYGITLWQRVGV